jgi:Di-haem cytochrome c peroxidase
MTRKHGGLTKDLVSIKPLSKPLSKRKGLALMIARGLVLILVLALTFPAGTVLAAPGSTRDNSGWIPFDQSFFAFEVESALSTLKEVPIWDEVEQMMDKPYAIFHDPSVGANTQGFPSYRSSLPRRRSFIFRDLDGNPCAPGTAGCVEGPLPSHVVHPPNYNYMNGEEMRMLNIGFEGASWIVPQIGDPNYPKSGQPPGLFPVSGQPGTYQWSYKFITVSPGEDRIEEDEPAIDFNSPIAPDELTTCAVTSELGLFDVNGNAVPEGSIICGGDPGEPGYAGFGILLSLAQGRNDQYSTPALPLPAGSGPGTIITQVPGFGTSNRRLFDPAGCVERNAKSPGSCSGAGFINRLLKPTLRPTPTAQPNYIQNSEANLAVDPSALEASNENDYYRGNTRPQKLIARDAAAALGKALFWDMQVGSDGVQACASCHFHAGADNRTKNQLNPNDKSGDLLLHVGHALPNPDGSQPANQHVAVADFPFHKLANPDDHAEDVNCGLPGLPPCSQGAISDVNDVMSSMGVIFSPFTDIEPIGLLTSWVAPFLGVKSVKPDIRTAAAVDPIPAFQNLRRVEPRNTPTLFATAMNFDNFWDGRARHDFNGGSVFGPSDPQAHVFVNSAGILTPTRQIIRFTSIASLGPGPALSNFEMSFDGRNWAKIAKKLLQGASTSTVADNVTPLANQLVDINDSVLGIYSNQGGSACTAAGILAIERSGSWVGASPALAPGKPGLCISYVGLIRRAFYPVLWNNASMHLDGCYTDDGNDATPQNTPVCTSPPSIPVLAPNGTLNEANTHDPFDGYVLKIAPGSAVRTNTNQFTQMEANFPLFWGLSIHAWVTMLIPDDSPMDRFYDVNPDSFLSFGESGEPGLVRDLLNCGQTNPGPDGTLGTGDDFVQGQPCFTPVGNFKRDPGVIAYLGRTMEGDIGTPVEAGGDRAPGSVDPLLGMDFFLGSNLSLKNGNFKSLRCGECHAGGTLTDHTFEISHQVSFNDFPNEFVTPGIELFPEPLGRSRVITGFSLEGELAENAQDAIERNVADFCTVEPCVDLYGNPIPGGAAGGFPQGQALFDNGVYNIGVRPIFEDISRGGNDNFGWPLSLSRLMFKNLGGVGYTPGGDDPGIGFSQPGAGGNSLPTFDPDFDPVGDPVGISGGLFEPTGQDQQINPGFKEEPEDPLLPPYLAKWASNFVVGDEMEQDEVNAGINTLFQEPMLEGLVDALGPFNPAAVVGEVFNSAQRPKMAMWPNVNRVNTAGAFKAPPLRHVELTGPYFHNGGRLTLRQVLDFYLRGGDFPKMNAAHRDFLIMNLDVEDEALGGCVDPTIVTRPSVPCSQEGAVPEFTAAQKEEIKVAVIDFLLELTDERVAFERAPFDHPEIFVPLDGAAPDNTFGRPGFEALLAGDCGGVTGAGPCFRQVPAVGQGGIATKLPNFLGITSGPRLIGPAADCEVPDNHYCH